MGEDHPDIATTLNNIASAYQAKDEHEAAIPLFLRAIEIDEKVYG